MFFRFNISLLRRLWRNREGVTAVEFAMVAPVLLLMLFGIIEFSLIMSASAVMEGAVSSSARLGKTGYEVGGVSRSEMIHQMIRDRGVIFLNPDLVEITTLSYGGFEQVNAPEPFNDQNHNGHYDSGEPYSDINGNAQWDDDMGAAGLGGAGDIVVYRVTYPWRVLTPIVGRLITNDGTFTISSTVVVKNEPYDIAAMGH